jgi:hypothetical protein
MPLLKLNWSTLITKLDLGCFTFIFVLEIFTTISELGNSQHASLSGYWAAIKAILHSEILISWSHSLDKILGGLSEVHC